MTNRSQLLIVIVAVIVVAYSHEILRFLIGNPSPERDRATLGVFFGLLQWAPFLLAGGALLAFLYWTAGRSS